MEFIDAMARRLIPNRYTLLCGISIGYPSDHRTNGFQPEKLGVDALTIPIPS
ncbi:hypothetical protein [Marinobacter halodurans]|uniref:hypothetical protein n=1 Tax=Marinobacter halodurans TaxID=2528979 RepID=UPI001A955EF1|nr:hypothetical protein [Marinobacter halodurans]